jgi:hypothetical protein
MIPHGSDMLPDNLLASLVEYQELQRQAVRRGDIPAANRHLLKVIAATDALAATPQGRDALKSLFDHPIADLRLRAAASMLDWAPDLAIPVLGRLLIEDLGAESSADEGIDIRLEASGALYRHFGIRSFKRNDLIEPLRAHGVEIPFRPEGQWK